MRAEEWLRPYGDRPASVYWVRRGVAAAAVLILLIAIWPSGGSKKKAPTAAPKPSPSARLVVATPACSSGDLMVMADSTMEQYTNGADPKIVITIKNTSSSACLLDTSKRYLTISSGDDLWWSSQACATGAQPKVTIRPASTVSSSYVWRRIREVTSCSSNGNAPIGTYLAKAHYAGYSSDGAVIALR